MKKTIYFIARALLCFFSEATNHNQNDVSLRLLCNSRLDLNTSNLRHLAALAYCEIRFERLLRNRAFRILPILILISTSISAQKKNNLMPIEIGDRIPIVSLLKVINYTDSTISLPKLKGKAIILDFWATFCAACIKEFPKLNGFQKKFDKNLQIILINTYLKDTVPILNQFVNEEKAKLPDFSLPIVPSNLELQNVFPIKSIPHYLWVGSDGRIKAVTNADQLTDTNVKRLIAGLTLNLKVKKD